VPRFPARITASNIHYRENSTPIRNSPKSDNNNDFPEIYKLLSGIRQKSMLASADRNYDDDGFIDIDELLSGMQQKSVPASADPNSGGMAKRARNISAPHI
jgi:hypothetical protein